MTIFYIRLIFLQFLNTSFTIVVTSQDPPTLTLRKDISYERTVVYHPLK